MRDLMYNEMFEYCKFQRIYFYHGNKLYYAKLCHTLTECVQNELLLYK